MSITFVPTEVPASSLHPSDATTYKENVKWSKDTPGTASQSNNTPLKQRTIASEIPLDQLKRHATTIDDGILPVDYLYGVGDDDQLAATAIMVQQGLDIDARQHLDNRWSPQRSRSSGTSAKTAGSTKRMLFFAGFNARQSMWL
ncbi:hypothetical protein B0H17DRAFT_1147917 [Mycena rosella]|uniref:Uncharacterized protein n=1 Tax=Mycena rosella TaxID=1033263 RepID=A0AAD7CHB9_MYCRO|nr:hypothetical protein B0H17DRAFT_1147917 [Mycena rosella]